MPKNYNFFESEQAGGIILIASTLISLFLANSPWQQAYLSIWHIPIGSHDFLHWINDGLMTVFFLMVGLELKREIDGGELSSFKKALMPIMAALGGMLVPALLYILLNFGQETQSGAGIPMATDIAFALGILSLLGDRIPKQLKVFLTTLAVVDDLGAIIIIALFYTANLAWLYLLLAAIVFGILVLASYRINNLWFYLAGGTLLWLLLLQSGVHATMAGVLLAVAIPHRVNSRGNSMLIYLEHILKKPVAFAIIPLFALANTGINLGENWLESLTYPNTLGIIAGLFIGKPLGIAFFSFLILATGISQLPSQINFPMIIGAGVLGGIGFTMSIFISLLAFENVEDINNSKFAVLVASLFAASVGYLWLYLFTKDKKFSFSKTVEA